MDQHYSLDEWNGMTNAERIEYCKSMAQRAFTSSKNAPPDAAEHYLKLTEYWLWLAHAIGRSVVE